MGSALWALALLASGCLTPGEAEPVQRNSPAPADTSGGADTFSADGEEVFEPPPLCQIDAGEGEVSYEADIRPLLTRASCYGCHAANSAENLGGLPDTVGVGRRTQLPIVTPCDPSRSALFLVVSSGCTAQEAGVGKMPPGSQGLSAEETALIQRWIAQGAGASFDAAACP
jgi:hypothetical protein